MRDGGASRERKIKSDFSFRKRSIKPSQTLPPFPPAEYDHDLHLNHAEPYKVNWAPTKIVSTTLS